MLCQLGRDRGERFQVVERRPAPLEVAGAEAGGDELLEQRRLTAGCGPERAQVSRIEAVSRKTAAGGGDLDVALAVEALARLDPRRDEVVLLEPSREVGRDARAGAELRDVELAAGLPQRRRPTWRPRWALRVDAPEKVQSLFPLIFVFLFLSSMSLPRDLIQTDWFRTVATYNPVSYMVEGLRSLLITGWDGEALALGFGCALGILAIGLYFASTGLKERMART